VREQQDAEANETQSRRHEQAPQADGSAHGSAHGSVGAAIAPPPGRRPVLTPGLARQLQRTGGNQAVVTLLRRVADEPGTAAPQREPEREPDQSPPAPSDRATVAAPGPTPPPPPAGDDASGPGRPAATPAGGGSAGAAPAPALTPDPTPAPAAPTSAAPATQTSAVPAETPGTEPAGALPAQDAGPRLGDSTPGAETSGAEGDDGSGVLAGALDTLTQRRAAVVEGAAARRTRIEQAASAYRESVGRSFTTQAQNVAREFDATVEAVDADLARRIQQVRSAETEHVAQAVATAGTEREQLGGLTRDRNASLDDAARTNADQVRGHGTSEGNRVIAGGEERARRAAALVDERAGPAAGNEGTAEFITKVRGGKLPQVQQKLRSSAQEVATGVRQQGTEVAGHITDEAADGRKELTGFFSKATTAVGDSHTETVRAIREAATAAPCRRRRGRSRPGSPRTGT
jgi:hypothetical protein